MLSCYFVMEINGLNSASKFRGFELVALSPLTGLLLTYTEQHAHCHRLQRNDGKDDEEKGCSHAESTKD